MLKWIWMLCAVTSKLGEFPYRSINPIKRFFLGIFPIMTTAVQSVASSREN